MNGTATPSGTSVVHERWVLDEGAWRCGNVAIEGAGPDPADFRLVDIERDEVLYAGRLWPAGFREDDAGWLVAVVADGTEGRVVLPTDGLDPWIEERQEAIEEYAGQLARERAESRIGRTARELLETVPEQTVWQVPTVLALMWAMKLAGREKSGKGTFIFYLLARLGQGRDTVFGPSRLTTSLILTEEPEESVREKVERFGMGDETTIVYGYELSSLPWEEKIARLVREVVERGHGILFIDNISRSAGVEDEGGVELARALEHAQDACKRARVSLIVDHHHKKGGDRLENKSRGGTATAGATDINVEFEKVGGWQSRKRRISAMGRLSATIWERTFELTEDGTDFVEVENETRDTGQSEQATMVLDLMKIPQAGETITVKGFAAAIGKTIDTARTRLRKLVAAGYVIEHDAPPGGATSFERRPLETTETTEETA
jgi:hypothetical protein